MSDETKIVQDTEAKVSRCPNCMSPLVEATTKGILPGGADTNRATCTACGWEGIVDDLFVQRFKHEMGDDEKLLQTMVDDLRNVLAANFAKAFGRFLLKWGFISAGVTPQELSRYIVAVAKATMAAILETRTEIEQEKQ